MFTSQKLTLRLLKCFAGDNRLMIVLNVILGQFSQIFSLFFSQKVDGIGFLKQYVAHIFFIPEHRAYSRIVPFAVSGGRGDTVTCKIKGNFAGAFPC